MNLTTKTDLSAQVAIVTGASQGLGKAVAIALAASGAHVVCMARNADKLADTVKEIEASGGKAEAVSCDVTDRTLPLTKPSRPSTRTTAAWTSLVNNAGITRDKLMRGMSDEEWDSVIATNLTSCFVCCRAAAGLMRRAKYGRIINMASVSGVIGNPGQANYSASKAGMIGMTRTISKELVSRGVTCNCVAPGFIESEMTAQLGDVVMAEVIKQIPAKRIGKPEDVAAAVLFLASPDAGYVSGQTLVVDGAMTS